MPLAGKKGRGGDAHIYTHGTAKFRTVDPLTRLVQGQIIRETINQPGVCEHTFTPGDTMVGWSPIIIREKRGTCWVNLGITPPVPMAGKPEGEGDARMNEPAEVGTDVPLNPMVMDQVGNWTL